MLFTKRLEQASLAPAAAADDANEKPEGEETAGENDDEMSEGDSPEVKHIKERLADTHDLLAEISLENER